MVAGGCPGVPALLPSSLLRSAAPVTGEVFFRGGRWAGRRDTQAPRARWHPRPTLLSLLRPCGATTATFLGSPASRPCLPSVRSAFVLWDPEGLCGPRNPRIRNPHLRFQLGPRAGAHSLGGPTSHRDSRRCSLTEHTARWEPWGALQPLPSAPALPPHEAPGTLGPVRAARK